MLQLCPGLIENELSHADPWCEISLAPEHGLKQVLLIDPDPVLRRSTALMFLQLGVVPLLAADIPGGFAFLDAEPSISCIVLDLALPDLHGADLRTVAPDIPILALQEHHLPDESGKHSTLWFDGLLTRPFTLAQLRDSLTAMLPDYGSIRRLAAPGNTLFR